MYLHTYLGCYCYSNRYIYNNILIIYTYRVVFMTTHLNYASYHVAILLCSEVFEGFTEVKSGNQVGTPICGKRFRICLQTSPLFNRMKIGFPVTRITGNLCCSGVATCSLAGGTVANHTFSRYISISCSVKKQTILRSMD